MIIGQSFAQSSGIRFIDKSTLTYGVSVTSQNVNVPACIDNDLLIAVIMHRSALTPQAGWTLVDSDSATGSGITQYLSVYKKTCAGDSGDSTTWTQSSAGRFAVFITAYRKIGDVAAVIDYDKTHLDAAATSPYATAISTADADGQMGVAYATYIFAANDALVTQMDFVITAGGGVQDTPVNVVMNRLCGGHVPLDNTEDTTGTVSTTNPGSDGGWVAVSLIIG